MNDPQRWQAATDDFSLWFWVNSQAIAEALPPDLFASVKFLASLRFVL